MSDSAFPGGRPAAVQDEDADAAERADGRLHEPLEMLRDRQVALDGERADALRLSLEHLAPSREHGDVRALRGKCLRDRETHAGRGAADDRRASGKPEIHGGEGYPGRCSGPVK